MRMIPAVSMLLLLAAAPLFATDSHRRSTGPPVEVKRLAPVRSLGASMLPAPPSAPTKRDDRRMQAIPSSGGGGPALLDLPFPSFYFSGLTGNDQYPPLYRFAVGEKEIVQVQGDRFRITDKCGGNAEDWTFSEFFQDAPVNFEQADVVYDRWGDRMFVMAAGPGPGAGDYTMYIGYWSEPWAESGWGIYFTSQMEDDGSIPTSNHSREMRMGLTSDMLYVSADQWSNGGGSTFQYSKLRVYNIANFGAVTDFTHMSNPHDSSPAVSIRPAKMHSYAATSWLINSVPGGDSYLTLWALTGPAASPNLARYSLNVSPYIMPEDAWQPDSTRLELGDCRIGNAAFHADTLWTTFTVGHEPQPGADVSAVRVAQIKASTQSVAFDAAVYSPGGWMGYPHLDVDGQGRGLVSFLYVETGESGYPPSTAYIDYQSMAGFLGGTFATIEIGLDSYSDPGGPPWPWGFAHGAARDPVDNTSMWVGGAYSMGPSPPHWATTLSMMSFEPPGALTVTPAGAVQFSSTDRTSTMEPESAQYVVTNTGGSMVYWSLEGADTLAIIQPEGIAAAPLAPGESDTVVVIPRDTCTTLPAGIYTDSFAFKDCISGVDVIRSMELAVGEDIVCTGTEVLMWPRPVLTSGSAPSASEQRGIFVTALKRVETCGLLLGLKVDVTQMITANIYEASGNTRGALIASTSWLAVPAAIYQMVPINAVLEACRDYNISFQWDSATDWRFIDTATRPMPVDLAGAIRARTGSSQGTAHPWLPYVWVHCSPLSPGMGLDLTPPGITYANTLDSTGVVHVDFTAARTMNLSGFTVEAEFTELPGEIYASIWEVGTTLDESGRGQPDIPGLIPHYVPLSKILYEGRHYRLLSTWSKCEMPAAPGPDFPVPWELDDWLIVDQWSWGAPYDSTVRHVNLLVEPFVAGTAFHLGKPDEPPPFEVTGGAMQHGAFITANTDLNAWALGWFADIPPGSTITARVYAASGTNRGALLSEGTITSVHEGMRWRHVPVSAELAEGADFDVEIEAGGTNLWRTWDEDGLPIVRNGIVTVVTGESGGNPYATGLLEMRLWACNNTATGIDDPVRPPQFFVGAPYPNPTGRQSIIDYSLDRAGTVEIVVYDVAGRRVATVLESTWQPAGPGKLVLDTVRLPAGVYFVKMRTPSQSVSRKITVLR